MVITQRVLMRVYTFRHWLKCSVGKRSGERVVIEEYL